MQVKREDERFWRKWKQSGAIGDINGRDYGRAYAFFDCKASLEEIAQEMPRIMGLVETSNKLETYLVSVSQSITNPPQRLSVLGPDLLYPDSEVLSIAKYAEDAGLKYALVARAGIPTTTNRETADELANILNQAYQSPLYKPEEEEPFRGVIVYEENGEYLSRE